MKISLVAVGEKMPVWVNQAYGEYQKRILGRFVLNLIEVPANKRTKNADIKRVLYEEENRIRQSTPDGVRKIALDRKGKSWSTLAFAKRMEGWLNQSQHIALIVGGPEGLSEEFLAGCDEVWSLSELTFAHPIMRIILAEQVYRCCSIIEGSPYHR